MNFIWNIKFNKIRFLKFKKSTNNLDTTQLVELPGSQISHHPSRGQKS